MDLEEVGQRSLYSDIQPKEQGFSVTSEKNMLGCYKSNYIDVYSVRITPPKITFVGAFQGKTFIEHIKIQNVGVEKVVIRIGTPSSFAFHIQVEKYRSELASGLSLSCTVTYTCKIQESVLQTQFPIHINNKSYIYKIDVCLAQPDIITNPKIIDFGIMNLGQSPIVKELEIINIGDKTTTFKIDVAPTDVDIVISPNRGELFAQTSLKMCLSLISAPIGYHIREFWLKSEPSPVRVTVEMVVIEKQLQIIHENSSIEFTIIHFPITFCGCERYDTFLLKNKSATHTTFVVLIEHNQTLYTFEEGSNMNLDIDDFIIKPLNGILDPFEELIFYVCYRPTITTPDYGWKHNKNKRTQHSVFLRIMNIQDNLQYLETSGILMTKPKLRSQIFHPFPILLEPSLTTMSRSGSSKSELEKSNTYSMTSLEIATFDIHSYVEPVIPLINRLCVHGTSEVANLTIEPNEIDIGFLNTTAAVNRVITLKNNSKYQDVMFNYIKSPNISVSPTTGILQPCKVIDIQIVLKPTTAGTFNFPLQFEVKGLTIPYNGPSDWIPLCKCSCTIRYEVSTVIYKKKQKSVFNTGLVPKNTVHPVGKNTDEIRFVSKIKKPKCTMLDVKWCPTHKNDLNDKCLIAFPNDVLPTKLQYDDGAPKYRTIFRGIPRYIPCTPSLYENFLKNLQKHTEYTYKSRRSSAPSLCSCDQISSSFLSMFNDMDREQTGNVVSIKSEILEDYPKSCCCFPLTPLQLFNIQVNPHMIQFGKVSTDLAACEHIKVTNYNNFKIKVELKSSHTEITFPFKPTAYVNPKSYSELIIRFLSKRRGKNHIIINYVINDSHSFDMDIFADVTKKHLILKQKLVEFNRNDRVRIFQRESQPLTIVNPVKCFTNFQWIVPNDSCYEVIPAKGNVPPLSTIICHLYRSLEYDVKKQVELFFVPESGLYESLNVTCNVTTPYIRFANYQLNVGLLPLNIPKIHTVYLYNRDQLEVMYKIINPNPIYGITVEPVSGVIRSKSVTNLYVHFRLTALIHFGFTVWVEIGAEVYLLLWVTGRVSYPRITIKPNKIKLRRISAHSFDRLAFVVQNIGSTEVTINQPTKTNFSEFVISDDQDKIISPFVSSEGFTLLPKKSKKLYVHFYPFDVASYEFYLPLIINNILGPVLLENEVETISPFYYLENHEPNYFNEDNEIICELLDKNIPEKLPVLRIVVTVQTHILQISKKHINFYFSTLPHANIFTHYTLIIKNVSTKMRTFVIRTDSIKNTPFTIKAFGKEIEVTDVAIIERDYTPSQELKLSVWFSPLRPGVYDVKLPIYVQNYDMGNVYNYLTLHGVYPESNISTHIDEIYFGPVPLGIKNERRIHIKATNYYTKSEIKAYTSSKSISVVFPDGNIVLNTEDAPVFLQIIISFQSEFPISVSETITFSDRFDNQCKIQVYGCADNSIVTTHEFLFAYREFIGYIPMYDPVHSSQRPKLHEEDLHPAPNLVTKQKSLFTYSNIIKSDESDNFKDLDDPCIDFPQYPDKSLQETEISKHLDDAVLSTETLLYERFFGYEYFPSIPEGILTMVTPLFEPKTGLKKSTKRQYFTIFQALNRLFGKISSAFFSSGPLPENNLERIRLVYIIFKQILDFVEIQGGCIKHIDPKLLLSYEDYVIFLNDILPNSDNFEENRNDQKVYDRKKHYLYCKRLWLDLLLQIYKIATLTQINMASLATHAKIIKTIHTDEIDNISNNSTYRMPSTDWSLSEAKLKSIDPHESNVFSLHERILLAWLNKHFEYQRMFLWKSTEAPAPRHIRNFDKDLSDALPLIFCTLSYCPYIVKEFDNLYPHIASQEMAYHNAAKLIEAWQKLNLDIAITPRQIVENDSLTMLFITAHLYFTLPQYLPITKIQLRANLSEITTRCIKVSTPRATFYRAYFIENGQKCFFTNKEDNIIEVNSKGVIVRLYYHAKKIERTTSTLLLIGKFVEGVYAENLIFTLEGEPLLIASQTVTVRAPLYENVEQEVAINVPYHCACDFEIFRTDLEMQSLEAFTAYPWRKQSLRKIPRIVYVKDTILKYTGKEAKLHFYLSILIAGTQNHYFVFVNKRIGDFIVNVRIVSKPLKKEFNFTYPVPQYCCSHKCICKKINQIGQIPEFAHCLCVTKIPIAKRNKYWWECFRKSMQQIIPTNEWSFWSKRLETSIGERLVQWLVNDENNPRAYQKITIYKVKETYTVENTELNFAILHPRTLEMEEMDTEGEVYLPVIVHKPGKYVLQLKSQDNLEIRKIVLTFTA